MGRIETAATDLSPLDARFHTINGPRAYESVVDQITFAIRSGVYRPGARLPTLQQLTATMGVSKPVIIEAIRVLSDAGVLQSKRGAAGGISVVSDNIPLTLLRVASGWQEAALPALLEARRTIEMQIALLAGERATESDLTLLRSAVEDLHRLRGTKDRYAQLRADHLFHYGMGRAARSEMLAYYQHQILAQLAKLFNDYERDFEEDQDLDGIITTHQDTLDALVSRDPALISAAMDAHLARPARSSQLPRPPVPVRKGRPPGRSRGTSTTGGGSQSAP